VGETPRPGCILFSVWLIAQKMHMGLATHDAVGGIKQERWAWGPERLCCYRVGRDVANTRIQ
jgi:hypothetical protein